MVKLIKLNIAPPAPGKRPIPYVPGTAPFSDEQRAWLNGFLAGLFSDAHRGVENDAPAPSITAQSFLVLFGSQTGTAERIARKIVADAGPHGFAGRVLEMNAFATIDFSLEERLVIVTSTWGDGDPPDNATGFWNHLQSPSPPQFGHLRFAVLALGDKNYSDFCGAGKKFDARLEQLGAKRLLPRVDCDTDYEATANQWMDDLWKALPSTSSLTPTTTSGLDPPAASAAIAAPSGYHRHFPFPARLLTNRKLNGPGSAKDTRHFEISLHGSDLAYEAGDALGVVPANCPGLVTDLLAALGCDGEEAVKNPEDEEVSLRHALLHSYQITQIPPALIQFFAGRSDDPSLKSLLDPEKKSELDQFLYGREVIDLFLRFPSIRCAPAELTGLLRKLQPRLYSISSSPKAHPGEVHLTVAAVRYEAHGRTRKGVCSTFLAERVEGNNPVPVFVQKSPGFRLPIDASRPVIMIGPGTGIAPFRAFLEERRATGAAGRNWLFFGDQQRAVDFLYREDLEGMLADKTLTRLDTAFSRDQPEKIYVQHRLKENAAELWRWLEEGAHLYVCGDARRMAKDVEAALLEIIQSAGGRSPEQAAAYVQELKSGKRYQRDVY